MGGLSIWHWVIVLVIAVLLFGRGRISETMGDFGKGIKSFRRGLDEDDSAGAGASARIESSSYETQPAADKTAG